MHRRPTFGTSAIALIVVALLASSAALGVGGPGEAYAAVARFASPLERSVGRGHDEQSERRSAERTAILRATTSALSRPSAPGAGTGSRGGAALGVASARLVVAVVRAPGQRIDVRRDGVPSPAQPTPPSRAPPLA